MDYTNLYNFQTSTGIIVPNDSSVLLGIQQKFQEIFGTDIDLSTETAVGRLIEAFSVVVKSTLGVTAQTANQFNVNEATGLYLDAIAQVYNLQRIAGTKTRINIKCFFTDSTTGTTTIPAGSVIMSRANGAQFRIDSAIDNDGSLVDEDGRIYALGTATAINTGPIVAPEGSVTNIQTGVLGWIGVTNVAPTYIGTNVETDEEFRRRILSSRPIGVGFDTHLVSALNRIEEVSSTCVLENNTGEDIVKQDVILPPHSIFVCLDFVESSNVLIQIGNAIAQAKPIGVGMVNDEIDGATLNEVTIQSGYNDGYSQNIYFYKAKQVPILMSIEYSYGKYMGADIEEDIREAVGDYVATIGVGGTLYASMLTNHLVSKLNIGTKDIWLQKEGSTIPADSVIQMNGYEVPIVVTSNIDLVQVA